MHVMHYTYKAPLSHGKLYKRRAAAEVSPALCSTSVLWRGFRFCLRQGALLADGEDLHEIFVREV